METKTVSALEDHLGYWLRLVSNHVSAAFAARLAEKGITVAEWVMLRTLYDGASLPSVLAERLDMTRGAITKLADRLEARRLVARAASAGDGRSQTVSLTAQGRALVPQLAMLADRNDAAFFAGISARDRAVLKKILIEIAGGRDLRGSPTE